MAVLPELMAQAGISNPVLYVEETKVLVKVYILAHEKPVVIRKPPPTKKTAAPKTTARKKRSPRTGGSP